MLYGLICIWRFKLYFSARRDCIPSTSVILDSRFRSWSTSSPLKAKGSSGFIAWDNIRSGKAAKIISYGIYMSLVLFSRIAFKITGRSSSYSSSPSMCIRFIALLIVCTILFARLFDCREYASVTLASVPSSFNAFFHETDKNAEP